MDEIQKVLIKAGRKDLAQKYYEKVALKEPERDNKCKSLDKMSWNCKTGCKSKGDYNINVKRMGKCPFNLDEEAEMECPCYKK